MDLVETAQAVAHANFIEELRAVEDELSGAMLRRDFAAFTAYIADDALFVLNGRALRGKPQIMAHWSTTSRLRMRRSAGKRRDSQWWSSARSAPLRDS